MYELEEEDSEFDNMLSELKDIQKKEAAKLNEDSTVLTLQEKNNIKNQINNCWNNIASKIFDKEEISNIKVKVFVSLNRKGVVEKVQLIDAVKDYMAMDNDLYRQVSDSAINSFYRCKKIFNLPKNKYEYWKQFEFTFDPVNLD